MAEKDNIHILLDIGTGSYATAKAGSQKEGMSHWRKRLSSECQQHHPHCSHLLNQMIHGFEEPKAFGGKCSGPVLNRRSTKANTAFCLRSHNLS
jgi:hypothetical protein